MKQRLVEEDSLHGVQVKVTHIHLQHLQPLEQVEEGDHLVRQDLESNELNMTNCFRQRFSSVKGSYMVPIFSDGAVIKY